MSAYKKFWLFTAILVGALVWALHHGLMDWFLAKFPDPVTQAFALVVAGVFFIGYAVSF